MDEIRTTGSATHNEGTITLRTAGAGTTRGTNPRAATALDERAIYGPRRIYRVRVQSALFPHRGSGMQFAIMTNESEDGTALGATYTGA